MEDKLLAVWEKLHMKLFNFIRSKIDSEEDAEDILQNVYIKIHTNIDSLEDENKLESWIFQIARNTIYDCYRKCTERYNIEFKDSFLEKEDSNLNEGITSYLKSVITELPDDSREIVELYEFQKLKHREIADKLGISENTSKSRLKRSREKLKQILDDCCSFEIDSYGNIVDYEERDGKS